MVGRELGPGKFVGAGKSWQDPLGEGDGGVNVGMLGCCLAGNNGADEGGDCGDSGQ